MFIKQYRHRLPADYDMAKIRSRAIKGGPLFDGRPGLAFKAFSIEERGRLGAANNAYSSLYLWFQTDAVVDFLWYEAFQNVFDTFGRPKVETWVAIDARLGRADEASMLYREDADIPLEMSLADLRASESEFNSENAQHAEVAASLVGIDLSTWRLARFTLAQVPLANKANRTAYQIAYLAKPGLHRLN